MDTCKNLLKKALQSFTAHRITDKHRMSISVCQKTMEPLVFRNRAVLFRKTPVCVYIYRETEILYRKLQADLLQCFHSRRENSHDIIPAVFRCIRIQGLKLYQMLYTATRTFRRIIIYYHFYRTEAVHDRQAECPVFIDFHIARKHYLRIHESGQNLPYLLTCSARNKRQQNETDCKNNFE